MMESPENSSDEAEFVSLLTSHQGIIHGYINSLLPGESSVEDVLQRANMVIWKKRADFELGTNFKAWALSIARWESRAWMTERKRSNWIIFDDDLANALEEGTDAITNLEPSDSIAALRTCLGKLRSADRTLILFLYQHEKSTIECAKHLKRSAGSLRVSMHRIRATLRRCIESRLALKNTIS